MQDDSCLVNVDIKVQSVKETQPDFTHAKCCVFLFLFFVFCFLFLEGDEPSLSVRGMRRPQDKAQIMFVEIHWAKSYLQGGMENALPPTRASLILRWTGIQICLSMLVTSQVLTASGYQYSEVTLAYVHPTSEESSFIRRDFSLSSLLTCPPPPPSVTVFTSLIRFQSPGVCHSCWYICKHLPSCSLCYIFLNLITMW